MWIRKNRKFLLMCLERHRLTSSLDSSLLLIWSQNTGRRMPRHNGKRNIFESTMSLMQIIFHCVSRPLGIFVIISTMKLLWAKIQHRKNNAIVLLKRRIFSLTSISTDHKFPLNPMWSHVEISEWHLEASVAAPSTKWSTRVDPAVPRVASQTRICRCLQTFVNIECAIEWWTSWCIAYFW